MWMVDMYCPLPVAAWTGCTKLPMDFTNLPVWGYIPLFQRQSSSDTTYMMVLGAWGIGVLK